MDLGKITVRKASTADVHLISQMAERIWALHYVPIIGKAQVDYMLTKMYSEKSLTEQMNSGQHFFIATINDAPIGYISFSEKEAGEFFLHKFYMEAEQQGKGFGKKIFAEVVSHYPQLKTIRLQVNRMNYKTINFYFKLGFIIEDAKDFDIGDGYSMDDFVMVWK